MGPKMKIECGNSHTPLRQHAPQLCLDSVILIYNWSVSSVVELGFYFTGQTKFFTIPPHTKIQVVGKIEEKC